MRKKLPQYILSLLLLTALGVGLFLVKDEPPAQDMQGDVLSVLRWQSLIGKVGAEEAHAQFAALNADTEASKQHLAAHAFGEALYHEEGVDGIAICDANFGFGCFHQFFLLAIAENGPDVLGRLDNACIKQFGLGGQGCQHGIGHGLVQYLGYDEEQLRRALELCTRLTWQEPLFGCQSGVFMEYNFPILIEGDTARMEPRLFDGASPFAPCLEIEERFHLACMLAQVEWWDKGTPLSYGEMEELCASVAPNGLRTTCYRGIGVSAVSSLVFDPHAARGACDALSSQDTRILCLSGVRWGFLDSGLHETADTVCAHLAGAERERCMREGDFPTLYGIQ